MEWPHGPPSTPYIPPVDETSSRGSGPGREGDNGYGPSAGRPLRRGARLRYRLTFIAYAAGALATFAGVWTVLLSPFPFADFGEGLFTAAAGLLTIAATAVYEECDG